MSKAVQLLKTQSEQTDAPLLQIAMFSAETWKKAMDNIFSSPLDPSLSAIQPLGDCIHLIKSDTDSADVIFDDKDADGLQVGIRMALFSVAVLSGRDVTNSDASNSFSQDTFIAAIIPLPSETQVNLLKNLLLVSEVLSDQQAIPNAPSNISKPTLLPALDLDLASIRQIMVRNTKVRNSIVQEEMQEDGGAEKSLLRVLRDDVLGNGFSVKAYYSARILRSLSAALHMEGQLASIDLTKFGIGKNGKSVAKSKFGFSLLTLFSDQNLLLDAATVAAYLDDAFTTSPPVVQLRNRLVSDLSGIKATDAITKAFPKLLLLNELWTSEKVENAADLK